MHRSSSRPIWSNARELAAKAGVGSSLWQRVGHLSRRRSMVEPWACMEALEQRQLLAVVIWDGGAGNNNWSTPQNWVGDVAPTFADDVSIGGGATIQCGGNIVVRSITSERSLSINVGSLDVQTSASFSESASVFLGNAGIGGGTWSFDEGGIVVAGFNSFIGNLTTNSELVIESGLSLAAYGSVTFPIARLRGTGSLGFLLGSGQSSSTITGDISIEGTAPGQRRIGISYGFVQNPGTTTLAMGSSILMTPDCGGDLRVDIPGGRAFVNAGLIDIATPGRTVSMGIGSSSGSFTNEGTFTASNGTLTIWASAFLNTGLMSVTNQTVNLNGTFASGIGNWARNGGTVNLSGRLNAGGGPILFNASTGSWNLTGGTINGVGQAIQFADGHSLVFTPSGGTLNSLTFAASISMPAGVLNLNSVIVQDDILIGNGAQVAVSGSTRFATARLLGTSYLNLAPSYVLRDAVSAEGVAVGARYVRFGQGVNVVNRVAATGSLTHAAGCNGSFTLLNNFGSATIINDGLILQNSSNQLQVDTGSFINNGTVRVIAGSIRFSSNLSLRNNGLFAVVGGTLNIEGTFHATAGIGLWARSGGTVNITGWLNNASNTLRLNASTGSWNLTGGYISGGSLLFLDAARLNLTHLNGTLDSVAITGELLFPLSASVRLYGTTTFTVARLLDGSNVFLGTGYTLVNPMIAEGSATGTRSVRFAASGAGTTTIGAAGSIRLAPDCGGLLSLNNYAEATLVNHGLISAEGSGRTLTISTTAFENHGTVRATAGVVSVTSATATSPGSLIATGSARIDFSGGVTLNGSAIVSTTAASRVELRGDLLGSTTNRDAVPGPGRVIFDGTGSALDPQDVEVMSADLGALSAGFARNFAFGTIQLASGAYVRLIDAFDNSAGSGDEVLYVNTLIVPAGSTLDLNGFTLYARASQILGTVIGGSISQVPDSGPIATAVPTPGAMVNPGEVDEWTFSAFAGRAVTIVVNPSTSGFDAALPPPIGRVRVQVLDPSGAIIASGSSATVNQVITLAGLTTAVTGTYRVRVQAVDSSPSDTGSYTITRWDSTPDLASLRFNQLTVGAIESPFGVDRWTFSAAAGQQIRFDLTALNSSDLRFTLTGPEGYVGFTGIAGDSALLTLPFTGQYVLAASAVGAATGQYGFRIVDTVVTDLAFETPQTVTHAGTDSAQLFRMILTAETPLLVRLDDLNNANRNEMYIRFGEAPTRSDYDYRYNAEASADQTLIVAGAQPGVWFILVYGRSVPSPSSFTIEASRTPIAVLEASPSVQASGNLALITIDGAGFRPGMTVELVNGIGQVIATAMDVEINGFASATATVSLAGVAVGQYDVRARLSGGATDTLPGAFRVTPGGTGRFESRMIMPGGIGRQTTATIYIEYANTGADPIASPLLRLQSSDADGSDRPLLTLDETRLAPGFWTQTLAEGFAHSVQLLASGVNPGLLMPGERITMPVYYAGLLTPWDLTDTQVEMEIRVFESTSTELIPWNDLSDELQPQTMRADAWEVVFANLSENVGSTWGQFVSVLSQNAQYLGRLGQNVTDVADLWSYEVQQAIGLNSVDTLSSALDASIATPGGGLSFGRSYSTSIDRRFEMSIFGRGWSTPWHSSLTVGQDGAVTLLTDSGSRRRFEVDARFTNRYVGLLGDQAVLQRIGSDFELRELSGARLRFAGSGVQLWSEDPNGNRVTLVHSGTQLTGVLHSSGGSLALAYNGAGRVISITDSVGRVTTYGYDPSNEYLISSTAWNGRTATYTYNTEPGSRKQHALLSITGDGDTQTFEYDNRGRLSATYRANNADRIDFTYGSTGRVSSTDAAGATVSHDIDHRGLVVREVDPYGQVSTAEYDENNRLKRLIDPLGQDQSFTWCSCGGLSSVTDAAGNTTRFTYASVGPGGTINRQTSYTTATGSTTQYTYDSRGNLTSIVHPDGPAERVGSYTPEGNPLSFINRRGQTVSYLYDAAGRVTRETANDGSFVTYAYDSFGRISSVTEPGDRVTTFTYTPLGGLSRVSYPGGRYLDFTYDGIGRRARMTDQDGFTVNYGYDALNRLQLLTDGSGVTFVAYSYDDMGRLFRKDNGNSTRTEYSYDFTGRLISIENRVIGGAINSRFEYGYDVLGRTIEMITLDGTWTYDYDAIGQLTRADFAPAGGSPIAPQTLEYFYDVMGNRTSTIENGVTVLYTANLRNQYTQVGGDVLAYDADGNLLSRSGPSGAATYEYDQFSRLTRVVTPDGTWEYQYDALGHRVASTVNGVRSEYLVDPTGLADVVSEYATAGSLVARYVYGFGLAVRQDGTSGQRAFYDFDHLGNTAGITDVTGAEVNSYAYRPFGDSLLRAETLDNDFEYVGMLGVMEEDNGLQFMRARFALPEIGRFIAHDPIGMNGGSANFYVYASNDPVNQADASGLFPGWAIDLAGSLIADKLRDKGSVSLNFSAYKVFGGGTGITLNSDGSLCRTMEVGLGAGVGGSIGYSPGTLRSGADVGYEVSVRVGKVGCSWGHNIDLNGNVSSDLARGCRYALGPQKTFKFFVPTAKVRARFADCTAPLFAPPKPPGGGAGGSGSSTVVTAVDPNALYGPDGYGPLNFVPGESTLNYLIEFENYGPGSENEDGSPLSPDRWASAPAQRVVITNDLSPSFDLSSFRYTRFGFGDIDILLPEPSQSWEQVLQITIDEVTFELWFTADIDYETRRLRMSFQSIDPATSLPPDVLSGFLPPEDGTGRGLGFVGYTIAPIAGLPTGTEIRNIALIQFDGQLLIPTNQIDPLDPSQGTDPDKEALVTIDSGRPQSGMDALQSVINASSFTLRWSGQDDAGGSGVVSYRVFISIDGGEYVLLAETGETEFEFATQWGRTYSFFTVAIDGVGNVEEAPLAPDATTRTPRMVAWDGGVDGTGTNLSDPVNWAGDVLPTADDNVVIDAAGGVQIFFAGELTFRSLLLAGHLTISSGTLTVLEHVEIDGELVVLGSLVAGQDVRSSGSIWLGSVALLQVGRDLLLSAGSIVGVDVRTVGEFGRITVGNVANLDGSLVLSFIDGYMPQLGDSLRLVTGASVTGEFAESSTPQLPGNFKSPLLTDLEGVRILFTSIADFNNSGTVEVADIFAFLSAWFAGNGDFDGNGTSEVSDIFSYLSAWFADN